MDMLIVRLVVSGLIVLGGFLYLAPPSPYKACVAAGKTDCYRILAHHW